MGHGKNRFKTQPAPLNFAPKPIGSLLDEMSDDGSYASLIGKYPQSLDLVAEFRRAISEVELITKRPLIVYAANVIRNDAGPFAAIDQNDDLPFAEMIGMEPASVRDVDVFLVTPGGSAQQVSLFVDKLRRRFDTVDFLLPAQCMSAGTIWAMSGDRIWMDERAYIGPIDPQVPSREGRWVPQQALLVLIKDIQEKGDKALKAGQNPDWTHIQLLNNIDAKEVGSTLSNSQYSIGLAQTYLAEYKFKTWLNHDNTGIAVTPQDKATAALEIATKLCSHEDWHTHSHGISREIAWKTLRLKIDHPESVPGLQRAMRRLWTLMYWTFENTLLVKCYVSGRYSVLRNQVIAGK